MRTTSLFVSLSFIACASASAHRPPTDAWRLYEQGSALAAAGKTDDALRTLQAAEARFPPSELHGRSVAAYRGALALEFAGRCTEAAAAFTRYADMVRPTQPALAADALVHIDLCVTGATDSELALRALTAALRKAYLDPTWQAVNMASTTAAQALAAENYDAALARADDGLKIAPDNAWLLYDRGAALVGMGRVDDGLAALRTAEVSFASGDTHGRAVAVYGRALALESVGRCDAAADEYRRYADLAGDSDPTAAARASASLRMCRLIHRPHA
jgi:tetratricopeptide (TPR) repeat protein